MGKKSWKRALREQNEAKQAAVVSAVREFHLRQVVIKWLGISGWLALILAILVTLLGCQGKPGTAGTQGTAGAAGSQGIPGMQGIPGAQGIPGTDATSVSVVKFCDGDSPSYPSTFPEYGLCIGDLIYGVYSANGGFLAELPPGTYSSNAVGSSCTFTIGPACEVERE